MIVTNLFNSFLADLILRLSKWIRSFSFCESCTPSLFLSVVLSFKCKNIVHKLLRWWFLIFEGSLLIFKIQAINSVLNQHKIIFNDVFSELQILDIDCRWLTSLVLFVLIEVFENHIDEYSFLAYFIEIDLEGQYWIIKWVELFENLKHFFQFWHVTSILLFITFCLFNL